MNPAFALNLFTTCGSADKAGKAATPGKSEKSLFRNLLMKENRERLTGEEDGTQENAILTSDFPVHMLRFEPGVKGKLETFFGEQGLTSKESAALIEGATDKDGFIRLDRLQAGFAALKAGNAKGQMSMIISARDVPQFQEVLFKMGLGAGEVKALVEKGNDGKGNMVLGKILSGLSMKFPEIDSQETLARLLAHSDIQCKNKEVSPSIKTPELRTLLKDYAATPSEDVQKNIKTRLADLLREKGVPPEKVKSFLEGMNVEYAEKASRVRATKEGKGATAAEIDLWDGVALKPQRSGKKDPWTEKILAILKESKTGVGRGGQGEGRSSRLASSALLEKESGGPRPPTEKVMSILDAEKAARTGKGSRGTPKSKAGDGRQPFVTGNPVPGLSDRNANLVKLQYAGQGTGNSGRALNDSQQASSLSNLLDRMQWMVEAGRQKARIQLSPPELGQIDLRLVIEQGHLHAHLGTDNPMVKEMIDSNLGQLKQQLSDLGFVVEEFSVNVGQDHREFGEGEDLWERRSLIGGIAGNGKPEIEPLSQGAATLRTIVDDRYQINVRI